MQSAFFIPFFDRTFFAKSICAKLPNLPDCKFFIRHAHSPLLIESKIFLIVPSLISTRLSDKYAIHWLNLFALCVIKMGFPSTIRMCLYVELYCFTLKVCIFILSLSHLLNYGLHGIFTFGLQFC